MTENTRRSDLRRAVARGASPAEAFLAQAPAQTSVQELIAGTRSLSQSLQGIDEPLGSLLATPGVTDLLINDVDEAWIDTGRGLESVEDFRLDTEVRLLAVRMAAAAGQRLDDATPIVDATLPCGVRLHAVLPPLSGHSAVISLRVPAESTRSLEELCASQMVSPWLSQVLSRLVKERVSGLITGATGTGKTTLLAALLSLTEASERLICIEEVSELRPMHPHVVHLQARRENVQGAGGVNLSDLVKAAMRMRPDRLILGEARGAEVREMLSALNTGHRGGWATLHANSALEVPARLEALGALASLSREAVCAQSLPAFEIIVHLHRWMQDGRVRRQVTQLARLVRTSAGDLGAQAILDIATDGTIHPREGWQEFANRLDLPSMPVNHPKPELPPAPTPRTNDLLRKRETSFDTRTLSTRRL